MSGSKTKQKTRARPAPRQDAKFVLVAVHELSRHSTPDEAKIEMAQYEATEQTTYYVARIP